MELVKILSKIINENLNIQKILLEYPESTIKRLVDKFSLETDDSEDDIKKVISDFERFKSGFANEDKDIFKHTYIKLKQLIKDKSTKQQTKKDLDSFAQEFVTKYEGTDLLLTKQNIKKYFELKTLFPEDRAFKNPVTDLNPSQLDSLVRKYFNRFNENGENALTKRMTEKFAKEIPDEDPLTVILPRVKRFVTNFLLIPLNTKLSSFMSFDEFEHIVDGYTPVEKDEYSMPEIDVSDVDIAYEDDDILIFAPNQKHKCINIRKKYAPDRTWCTSGEGSGNYYYNYRLTQNLTLYYVISKNLEETDLNYAVVILVDKYGRMRYADGNNRGRYAGGEDIPWNEITQKVPSLKGKEGYLVPKPFTDEDTEKLTKYKTHSLTTSDPVKELGSIEEVELWMELRGPDFRNITNGAEIFGNLPEELQKKYIGLGNELDGNMVRNLTPGAMSYYVSKKKERILTKTLREVTENDIEVILSKEMRPYFRDLKRKYKNELNRTFEDNKVLLQYPKDDPSKFIVMFGFEEFFESLPENMEFINIENKGTSPIGLDLPESIGKFKNLDTLVLDNMIKSIPESIGECKNLTFLNLTNNIELERLPKSMVNLTCLEFVSIEGSNPDIIIPDVLRKYMTIDEDFFLVEFPDNMKQHCKGITSLL